MRLYRPYRGKRTDNGEWVKGWLKPFLSAGYEGRDSRLCIQNGIHSTNIYEVVPESVGQYTGLSLYDVVSDENEDIAIYEGDIIDADIEYVDGTKECYRGVVRFADGLFCLCSVEDITHYDFPLGYFLRVVYKSTNDIKIIGNYYDNPELLKEAQT